MSATESELEAESTSDAQSSPRWKIAAKIAASVWILYHVTALFSAPAAVAPASELERSVWESCQLYLEVLYLNHGYHYFAPEPGESRLLGFAVERADGTVIQGRIPNRDIHPRLLYHRHFMLTEYFGYVQGDLDEDGEEDIRQFYEAYARQLCRRYEGERVSLTRITHYLPPMEYVRDGVTLDNPESYEEEFLGTYEWDELSKLSAAK